MEKREKIIRELEIVKRRVARLDHFEEEAETIEDAIVLLREQQETIWALEIDLDDTLDVMCKYAEELKAREPRVLTLEEVIQHYSLPPDFVGDLGAHEDYYGDIQPLYFEFPHDSEEPWVLHWRGHAQVARYLDEWRHSYNKKWRCWISRPTEEQRKAVKWDAPEADERSGDE